MKKLLNAVFVVAALAMSARVVRAEAESYSTKPWLHLNHVQTEKQFGEIPNGATVAMACSKCKSVTVISQQWKGTKPSQGTIEKELIVHQCPGCGGKMTTELKQTKMIHTCSKCGEDSAYCCATTAPGKPTPGMEKK
jgi:hypothetical protein